MSSQNSTCQALQFSYGVHPVYEEEHPEDWNAYVKAWLIAHKIQGNLAILTEGPSSKHPDANNRVEIIDLEK